MGLHAVLPLHVGGIRHQGIRIRHQGRSEARRAAAWPSRARSRRGCDGSNMRGEGGRRVWVAASCEKGAGAAVKAVTHGADEEAEHPRALNWMIMSFTASCVVERTWRFALPILLAKTTMAVFPIALMGVFSHAGMLVGGPLLGRWMDRAPRGLGLLVCLVAQNLGILCSGVLLWIWMLGHDVNGAVVSASGWGLLADPIFIAMALCNIVEVLSAMGSDTAYEKDWVACLAGPRRPVALARANSLLRLLDMSTELLGPLTFVLILDATGVKHTTLITGIGLLLFLPFKILSVLRCVALAGPVLDRVPTDGSPSSAGQSNPVAQLRLQSNLYASIPTFRASIAWVLQGMSVLSPEGLLAAFLIKEGFSGLNVGIFRAVCAAVGIVGILVSPRLIASRGLLWCGNSSLRFQAACVAGAAACFVMHCAFGAELASRLPIWTMLSLVSASKGAMWMYDIVAAQLFQSYVPNAIAATAGIMELTCLSFVDVLVMGVSTLCGEFFLPVVLLSVIGVGASAHVFSGLTFEKLEASQGRVPKRERTTPDPPRGRSAS